MTKIKNSYFLYIKKETVFSVSKLFNDLFHYVSLDIILLKFYSSNQNHTYFLYNFFSNTTPLIKKVSGNFSNKYFVLLL